MLVKAIFLIDAFLSHAKHVLRRVSIRIQMSVWSFNIRFPFKFDAWLSPHNFAHLLTICNEVHEEMTDGSSMRN